MPGRFRLGEGQAPASLAFRALYADGFGFVQDMAATLPLERPGSDAESACRIDGYAPEDAYRIQRRNFHWESREGRR